MEKEFNLTELGDWNKTEATEDFFNDAPEIIDSSNTENVVRAVEGEDTEEDEPSEKKEEIDTDSFFDDDPNKGAQEVETPFGKAKKEGNTTEGKNVTISAAQLLLDKGIIDFDLKEGEELDEDTALELLEEGFESGVENRVKDLMQSLPPELQALNKFVINGGEMGEFLSQLNTGKSSGIHSNLDITDENNQELVIKEMYKAEGMDEDFIETSLETLKDTGKLADFARKRFNKWKEQDTKAASKKAEEQEQYVKIQREKQRQYFSNLKNVVTKEEFDSIKLSNRDKNEIPGYMTDRNIKLNNGAVVTPFNQALMETMQNEKASIQLAVLLKNRKEDGTFDFSQIEKTATTKIAREVKNNLRQNKETPKKSIETNSQSRSLADYF